MLTRRFDLLHVFGIPVRTDASGIILALVMTAVWALQGYPSMVPDQAPQVYWAASLLTTIGLFVSALAHKAAHALTARHFKLGIKSITLALSSGGADLHEEARSPQAEATIALAGPWASGIATGGFILAWLHGSFTGWSPLAMAFVQNMALANGLLFGVNLVPALPLDGGRVLRALLWWLHDDPAWALRFTCQAGSFIGIGALVFGVVLLLIGLPGLGVPLALMGLLIRLAATVQDRHALMRGQLERVSVQRLMQTRPAVATRAASIRQLVEDLIERHQETLFPVVDGDRLVGCVRSLSVETLPAEEWERQSVGSLTEPCLETQVVTPGTDAYQAFLQMQRSGDMKLFVVDGERLVGVLTYQDLLRSLTS